MAIIKVVNESYSKPNDIRKVINYICHGFDCSSARYGSDNVLLYSLDSATNQFQVVKNIFYKTDGRQLRHFIVSFSKSECNDINSAFEVAQQIAHYYSLRYQIIYSVHTDTDDLHIHFVINSVSYVDGKMFSEGPKKFNEFTKNVESIIVEQ